MLMLFETIVAEMMAFGPEYLVLFGTPELKLARPRRFVRVFEGRKSLLVEI